MNFFSILDFLEEFEKKHKNFNVDLKRKDNIIEEQAKSLDEKNRSIKTLQDRVRTLEKRLEVDSKFKDEIIKQLKQQVDQQSGQIAQLTFQLHSFNQNKLKLTSSQNLASKSPRNEINEPKIRGKSTLNSTTNSSQERMNETIASPDKLDTQMKSPRDFSNTILPNRSSNLNIKRQSSASSISSESTQSREKSPTTNKPQKSIQLQEVRTKNVICPDPMPFLNQASVAVSEIDNEKILKRPNGVLPPIKLPPKFNKIVVESPHKTKTNTILQSSPDLQSNNK